MHIIGRRHFLAAAGLSLLTSRPSFANVGARTLVLDNIHTGEKLKVDYWVEGRYLPDALAAVTAFCGIFAREKCILSLRSCSTFSRRSAAGWKPTSP